MPCTIGLALDARLISMSHWKYVYKLASQQRKGADSQR